MINRNRTRQSALHRHAPHGCDALGTLVGTPGKVLSKRTSFQPDRRNLDSVSGIDVLSLWMEAEAKGYTAQIWIAYRQAMELMAHVRKGERGSLVVFCLEDHPHGNQSRDGWRRRNAMFPSCFGLHSVQRGGRRRVCQSNITPPLPARLTQCKASRGADGVLCYDWREDQSRREPGLLQHCARLRHSDAASSLSAMPRATTRRSLTRRTHNAEAWIMPHGAD